jgi:putative ABC transport system permease protein
MKTADTRGGAGTGGRVTAIAVGPALAGVLGLLTLVAAAIVRLGGLGDGRRQVTAALRATVQLAAVSLVIAAVLRSWWWTALFVGVMAAVAAVTSAARIAGPRLARWTALPVVAAAGPVVALLLLTGLVPAVPVVLVPIAGILIGNSMTATSLAGRRALDELRSRHGEYEAALALGFLPRDAALEVCRQSAGQALVPGLDQTRTVGLVTLPGAFVGMLLGGAGPVQAGVTQLVVLVALLAAQSVAVLITLELVATGRIRERPPGEATRACPVDRGGCGR